MAETWGETIIPGTFIRVLSEGLISVGGISAGTVGIVGTADKGQGETHLISDYAAAQAAFGPYDAASAGTKNLTRALEILYRNGARKVVARAVPVAADKAVFGTAFAEVIKEDVQIVVAPELKTDDGLSVLGGVITAVETAGRDVLAIVGSDADKLADLKKQIPKNPRIVFVAPGIQSFDAAAGVDVNLNGNYAAAAVAGLVSSLSPESSPTNKPLPGVVHLTRRFSYAETSDLVANRVLVLEERGGVRVVRGITTDDGAFAQITTRRITDYAKAGMRKAGDPFIGRLNNERVRKALRGAIDGFLTSMVVAEQLISYELDVSATRAEEIAGKVMVNAVLRPTFSIDYVMVTLVLE